MPNMEIASPIRPKSATPFDPDPAILLQMSVADHPSFHKLQQLVSEFLQEQEEGKVWFHNSGDRKIYWIGEQTKQYQRKFNREITVLTKLVARSSDFTQTPQLHPIWKKQYAQNPAIIHAPCVSSKSNEYTHGNIHRDFHGEEDDVFSVELLLDRIYIEQDGIPGNGSIRFYGGSRFLELDEQHRSRSVEGMQYTDLVGDVGDLFIWNSKTVHQSLANGSSAQRECLHWYVTGGTGIKEWSE